MIRWQEEYARINTDMSFTLVLIRVCIVLQRVAGKDASKQFWKYHNDGILKKYKSQLQIGSLDTKKVEAAPAPAPAPAAPSPAKGKTVAKPAKSEGPLEPYGDLIPFADPSWYQGVCVSKSPKP